MISILFVMGILTVIGGLILGIASGTFWGFITAFTGGAVASLLYFALSKILENQANIEITLHNISERMKNPDDDKKCSKCGKTYDYDVSSCPHCGFRE